MLAKGRAYTNKLESIDDKMRMHMYKASNQVLARRSSAYQSLPQLQVLLGNYHMRRRHDALGRILCDGQNGVLSLVQPTKKQEHAYH